MPHFQIKNQPLVLISVQCAYKVTLCFSHQINCVNLPFFFTLFIPDVYATPGLVFQILFLANLQGVDGLNSLLLDMAVLRDIYENNIQTWNHPALVELNPGENQCTAGLDQR